MYTSLPHSVLIGNVLLRFKYRDRASIVADVLDVVRDEPEGRTKTSIMRGANLNFEQVNRYLELLVLRGLISEKDPLRSQELARYKLTRRGLDYLRAIEASHFILR